jgi:DNA-binding NarL/FixJ family response regulator
LEQEDSVNVEATHTRAAAASAEAPLETEARSDERTATERPLRLLVVARHALLRRGVVHSLQQDRTFEVVDVADSLEGALTLARDLAPDVVLVDSSACDEDAAVHAQTLRRDLPGTAVVLLVRPHGDAGSPLQAAAVGAIARTVEPGTLCAALRGLVSGVPGDVPAPAAAPTLPAELTEREYEVLTGIANGLTNREIAGALWLSAHTVKFHTSRLYRKVGVRSRAEAARWLSAHAVVGGGGWA